MRPSKFRDWLFWLVIVPILGILCATHAWGEVTIQSPPHKVVAGWPSLFRVDGLQANDLGRVAVVASPATCRVTLTPGPHGGQFVWFEPTADGLHVLALAIGTDTKPTVIVIPVEVGGDGPQPDPDPDPIPPPPPPGARHIVVIIERSTPLPTPEQAKVLAALDLWKDSRGYTPETYRVADPNQLNASEVPVPRLQPYLQALQQRGIKHPAIIVDAEPFGSVEAYDLVEPLPATGAAAIEMIQKGGG